jgi:aspartate/methionine/tyrosine aminotransferase
LRLPIPQRTAAITAAEFDVLNTRAEELRGAGHTVISLGQALPGFGPPSVAIAAAHRALDGSQAHVYSADAGLPTLRAALCEKLGSTREVNVAPDEVIITAGGNQAFMLAVLTVLEHGDEVLLPAPYFVNHEMALAALGAVPVEVPLSEVSGFNLRWEDLEPRLSNRTRAVVVCTPSNPTGAVVPGPEMVRITRELATRNVLLIVDETYADFVYRGSFTSIAAYSEWRDNVIVVSTFSKSFGMTGWRVGYMMAAPHVCDQAIKIQDAMIICAPVPSQMGVEAAIRDAWAYPRSFIDALAARRRLLADGLRRISRLHWTETDGGFFAFVGVAGCTNSAALAREIIETAHVVTIPGSTFGRCGEGFLRLSYSAVSDEALQAALTRLERFFSPD